MSDSIARQLLRLIAAGELSAGERLPGERQLAEMMNVSRVSVRAALQQLKAQGFLSAVQGGGTRVAAIAGEHDAALAALVRLDERNLYDLAEIRLKLEVWAAERAAERASEEQIAEIRAVLDLMADPARPARYKAQDDLEFHLAIARAANSAVFLHLVTKLGDVLERMVSHHRYGIYTSSADDQRLLEDHRAILAAIEARDGTAAARAMERHLERMRRGYGGDEPPRAEQTPDPRPAPPRVAS